MRRPGFTLIELLVVLGIIAVLASILWPAVVGSAQKAQDAKCVEQLRQFGAALIEYEQSHGGYPKVGGQPFLADLFRRGLAEDSRIFVCPRADEAQDDGWERRGADALAGKPGDPVGTGGTSYWGRLGGAKSIREARARRVPASQVPVACDGCERGPDGTWTSPHADKVHVLYLDGHVEAIPVDEFAAETWARLGEHPRRVLGK